MALPVATVQAPEKVTSPDEVGRVSAFLLVAPGETLVARGQATGIEAIQKAYAIWEVDDGLLRGIQFFVSDEELDAAFDAGG